MERLEPSGVSGALRGLRLLDDELDQGALDIVRVIGLVDLLRVDADLIRAKFSGCGAAAHRCVTDGSECHGPVRWLLTSAARFFRARGLSPSSSARSAAVVGGVPSSAMMQPLARRRPGAALRRGSAARGASGSWSNARDRLLLATLRSLQSRVSGSR